MDLGFLQIISKWMVYPSLKLSLSVCLVYMLTQSVWEKGLCILNYSMRFEKWRDQPQESFVCWLASGVASLFLLGVISHLCFPSKSHHMAFLPEVCTPVVTTALRRGTDIIETPDQSPLVFSFPFLLALFVEFFHLNFYLYHLDFIFSVSYQPPYCQLLKNSSLLLASWSTSLLGVRPHFEYIFLLHVHLYNFEKCVLGRRL